MVATLTRPVLNRNERIHATFVAFQRLLTIAGIIDDTVNTPVPVTTKGHLAVMRDRLLVEKIVLLPSDQDEYYARPVYFKNTALFLSVHRAGPRQLGGFEDPELAMLAWNYQLESTGRPERLLYGAHFDMSAKKSFDIVEVLQ